MDLGVLCVRKKLYVLVSVSMMFGNAMSERCNDHFADELYLAVALVVRRRGDQLCSTQTDSYCCQELGQKPHSLSVKNRPKFRNR